ncbi:MAG: MFS transporter [Clostridia bacterium]|nr:MFS transporter [Clostridia bacterium]
MRNRYITYICYALIFLFAMFLVGTSPLLTEISKTFNLTPSQSGTVFSYNFIGFVVFVLIGGIASDRFGKKIVLNLSLVGFSITLFVFPLSGNFYVACVVMLLLGGFGGLMESVVCALVADMNTENTSFYMNLLQVFFGLGALAGPVIISILISNGITWQISYYIFGILSIILTVMSISAKFTQMDSEERLNFKSVKAVLTSKKVILAGLCMLFYTGSEVGSWGWMATYLKKNMDFSALRSSIAVGVFWMAMALGRLACGPVILKFGARKIVVWLATSSAFIVFLSGIIRSELLIWIIIVLMGFAFSSQWALIASYGSEEYKELSGTAYSLFLASGGAGGALIPYIMGVVSEETDMRIAMMSPAILLLAIAVIFIYFKRLEPLKK